MAAEGGPIPYSSYSAKRAVLDGKAEALRKQMDEFADAELQTELEKIENRRLKGEIGEGEADSLKASARHKATSRKLTGERDSVAGEMKSETEMAQDLRQKEENARL